MGENGNDAEPILSQNNNEAAVEVGNEVEDSNEESSTTSEDDVEQVNVEANSKRPLSDIFDESSQTDAVPLPAGEEMQNDIEGGDIIKANSENDLKTDESTTLECSGTADDVSSTCVDDQCTISCSDGNSVQLQCGEGESTSVNTEEVSDKLIVTASCGPELKFPA